MGEGEGFNLVGVDTLGPVVRGCLKAIVRNATQRAWWVRVGCAVILTQFPRVLVSVTLSVCLSVLLQLCCQCVHCISLEWNFTFCNAGEKLTGISVVKLCGAASW